MKKTRKLSLLLIPALATLFSSCAEENTTRDVYQSQDECAQDWSSELCERMGEEDELEYHRRTGFYYPVFYGPEYYPNESRSVVYKGRTITPTSRHSTLSPMSVAPRSSSFAKSGAISVRTGGFGHSGISSGG